MRNRWRIFVPSSSFGGHFEIFTEAAREMESISVIFKTKQKSNPPHQEGDSNLYHRSGEKPSDPTTHQFEQASNLFPWNIARIWGLCRWLPLVLQCSGHPPACKARNTVELPWVNVQKKSRAVMFWIQLSLCPGRVGPT